MSTNLSGNVGPHPDLIALAAQTLSLPEHNVVVAPDDVQFLQQRTFRDLAHPRTGEPVAISSCLVVARHSGHAFLALVEAAQDSPDGPWFAVGSTSKPIIDAQFTSVGSVMPKLGLNVGLYTQDPRIARLRIELADGTADEDMVGAGSAQVLLPFRSSAAWADDAVVRLLDDTGDQVVSQRVHVHPRPPAQT